MTGRGRPPKLPNLTPQQFKILSVLVEGKLANGKTPSGTAIATDLGLHRDTVYDQIVLIEKKGWIRRQPRKHGVIWLSPQALRNVTGKSPKRLKSKLAVKEVLDGLVI